MAADDAQNRKLIAEFFGTGLLLATVVGSGIMGDKLSGGNVAVALLANSLATGAILYVLITIFGPISGAHFNPAVTLVMRARGDMTTAQSVGYALAQVAGGVLGVLAAHLMFDLAILQASQTARHGVGQWFAEIVATFGLLLAILGAVRFRPEAVAATVGLYITAAYWFTASTSFANPAVTIARGFTNTFAGIAPGDILPFVVMQVVGALLAFALGRVLFDRS